MPLLRLILRLFFRKPAMFGLDRIQRDQPAVFVSNHLGAHSPILLTLHFPIPFRPWAHAHVTRIADCRDYLEENFTRHSLKLKPPFSRWLAALLARPAVWVMRKVRAIPVYRGSPAIHRTFALSLDTLKKGDSLLIFPEDKFTPFSDRVHDFFPGFTLLSRLYRKETGQELPFYPLYVDRSPHQHHGAPDQECSDHGRR
ncbi:MAG TPA: hypothetical protein PK646_01055, partial [Bacillota bacterium]|nr:hypothetical protein [Bacillota bacterium]